MFVETLTNESKTYVLFVLSLYMPTYFLLSIVGSFIAKMKLVSHVPVKFRLVSNTNLFSIDGDGEVTLTSQIDREKSSNYIVGVLAYTESSPALTALSELFVQIVDHNDNIPQFENDVYSISLAENMPAGTSLLKGML